jgi:hypothetical protein
LQDGGSTKSNGSRLRKTLRSFTLIAGGGKSDTHHLPNLHFRMVVRTTRLRCYFMSMKFVDIIIESLIYPSLNEYYAYYPFLGTKVTKLYYQAVLRVCLVGDQNLSCLTFSKLWPPQKVWRAKSKQYL